MRPLRGRRGAAYAGAGTADVWLVKTTASGTELWSRTFGGAGWEVGLVLQETGDGG